MNARTEPDRIADLEHAITAGFVFDDAAVQGRAVSALDELAAIARRTPTSILVTPAMSRDEADRLRDEWIRRHGTPSQRYALRVLEPVERRKPGMFQSWPSALVALGSVLAVVFVIAFVVWAATS